jgi:uncharacterized protein YjbI with pentapeptide repeats
MSLDAADLSYADLQELKLSGTNLNGAILNDVDLSAATFSNVLLVRANLEGAKMTTEQVAAAESLKGASMPNGQKYEDWLKSKGRGEDGEDADPS